MNAGCLIMLLSGGGGILFFILAYVSLSNNNVSAAGIYIVLFIILWIILLVSLLTRGKKIEEEESKVFLYDKNNSILRVFKRSPILRSKILIVPSKNYTSHVTPTKVHIGAATVGGVTTGGVYTTGGQRVVDNTYDSGYYCLKLIGFSDSKSDTMIKTIQITKEMYEEAKESSIKNYLSEKNGDYFIIVNNSPKMSYQEIQLAMKDLHSTITQDMAKRGYPSKEKCEKIVNWLSLKN